MNLREIAAALPLVILVFYVGLYPNAAFQIIHASADNLIKHVHAKAQVLPAAAQAMSTLVGN
jgi:NADH:ubiquinone oxidoreductase subunit 4 (subunit M)